MTAQYSDEIREKICEGIAEGKSLRKVCLQRGFPTPQAVVKWLLNNDYPAFSEQYAQARMTAYQLMADDLFNIADDGSKDTVTTAKGKKEDKEWTSRSRLKVDTRKWFLSKVLPKMYGDKLTLAGDAENPIVTQAAVDTSKLSVEELQMYLELVRKMKQGGDNDAQAAE